VSFLTLVTEICLDSSLILHTVNCTPGNLELEQNMSRKLCIGMLLLTGLSSAQHRVDPRNSYNRVICVVPIVGNGTPLDPKRPMYAPWPLSQDPNGIIAFTFELSDDGQRAIVEFVARTRAAFQTILSDTSITAFEKGKAAKADVEAAVKKARKDFDMDKFGTVMP
jgi:hypothetical protein